MRLKDYRFQALEPIFKENFLSSLTPTSSITFNFRSCRLVLFFYTEILLKCSGMKFGISNKLLGENDTVACGP